MQKTNKNQATEQTTERALQKEAEAYCEAI